MRAVLVVVFLGALGCPDLSKPLVAPQEPPRPISRGTITVERVYEEYGFQRTVVSYKNDTATTFRNQVAIECVALDKAGKKINVNDRVFFAHEQGPIAPGFEGTLNIPVSLNGAKSHSASCRITKAL